MASTVQFLRHDYLTVLLRLKPAQLITNQIWEFCYYDLNQNSNHQNRPWQFFDCLFSFSVSRTGLFRSSLIPSSPFNNDHATSPLVPAIKWTNQKTKWLSSLCIASNAVSILYKITEFATFTRSQIFSGGSLFYKQNDLFATASLYRRCLFAVYWPFKTSIFDVRSICHFSVFSFILSRFLSFFWGEGVISIHLGYKGPPKNIPNEEVRVGHQILHELPV